MLVYKLTSPSNKCYIGITTMTLEKRLSCHFSNSKKHDTKLYFAFRKYGFDTFKIEILEECSTREELIEKEITYIEQYNSYHKGYNMTTGGEGVPGFPINKGRKHSEETKKRWSEQRKGHPAYPNQIKKAKELFAKTYLVIPPSGKTIQVNNLRQWCKENGLDVSNITRSGSKGYKAKLLPMKD